MVHDGPVFLSTSVPEKGDKFYKTANPHLIRMAIVDLVEVILGRRLLVWGGHPAITPIICQIAKEYEINYESVVNLYQSKFFQDRYPTENKSFKNITEVDAVKNDEKSSLKKLRNKMLSSYNYSAAVFIGGKKGIIQEFEIFRKYNPNAKLIVLPSTGGASKKLFDGKADSIGKLRYTVNYSHWFREMLEINVKTKRREFKVEEIRKKWRRKSKNSETGKSKLQRDQLYREFWKEALYHFKSNKNISPYFSWNNSTKDHALSVGSGLVKCPFKLVLLRNKPRVELWFYVSDGSKTKFDSIFENKVEIEKKFGSQLDWQRLPNKKVSRIAFHYESIIDGLDKSNWPELIEWYSKNFLKLERALKSSIEKISNR